MQSPVALELLELLSRAHIPQPDRPVVRPTDKQGGIRRIETDAIYRIAAIFSNVSFTGTTLRLSPGERGDKKKSLANLWPSSVFRRSPFFGSHRMLLLSTPPLARSLTSKRHPTVRTKLLPFSQMSGNTYVVVVYASPPLNLRLSPGERGRAAGKIVTLTVLPAMAQNKQVSGGDKKKKAWLTCGPRTSSGASPFLGPTG